MDEPNELYVRQPKIDWTRMFVHGGEINGFVPVPQFIYSKDLFMA